MTYKNVAIQPVPTSAPVFVCPAKAKQQIQIFIFQIVGNRGFQQTLAAKPVEIETEALYSIQLGQFDLTDLYIWVQQIVIAEFSGEARLIMAFKLRKRRTNIAPLSEPLTSPFIVFWNRVKLGKVKADQADRLVLRRCALVYRHIVRADLLRYVTKRK